MGDASAVGVIALLIRTGDAVMQLDLTGDNDHLARVDTFEHRDLIAARRPSGDEGLARNQLRLAAGARALVVNHINGVAIGIIGDRGLRQRHVVLRCTGYDVDRGIHAGQQLVIRVF